MTIMDGKIVYADAEFAKRNPPLPPAMPDWSPVNSYGGYYTDTAQQTNATLRASEAVWLFIRCACMAMIMHCLEFPIPSPIT